jgi:hypothetical protein
VPAYAWDRVKETTITTGTGALTLAGAVVQFKSFSSRFATGATAPAADPIPYAIVGQGTSEWEVGEGYITSGTNFVRDRVIASSNADAAVNFSAGTKDVFCTLLGQWSDRRWSRGQDFAKSGGSFQ